MGNLEKILPKESKTVKAIMDAWKDKGDSEAPRTYLGASILGHHCSRYLWYEFRWCGGEDFPGRLYRLFDRGNCEEPRMVADLKMIGCTVHETGEDGEQFAVSFADGHGGGHMDGCALGIPEAPKTWHVIEFKTHSTKSFRALEKDGVQQSKPMHWAQMQIYMCLTKMTRALYLACNKDTDALYAERIRLDKESAMQYVTRAERITKALAPPLGAGSGPDDPGCKYCPHIGLCFGNPAGVACPCKISCRSCVFATPEADGKWVCGTREKELSHADQVAGCSRHVFGPGLIHFAEMINAGKAENGNIYAEYMNESDNTIWINGSSKVDGHYSSVELTKMPYQALCRGCDEVSTIKKAFKGEVVG